MLIYYRFCNINKLKNYCIPHLVDQTGFDVTFFNQNDWIKIAKLTFSTAKKSLQSNELTQCLALVLLENIKYHKDLQFYETKNFNNFLCSIWSIKFVESKDGFSNGPDSQR